MKGIQVHRRTLKDAVATLTNVMIKNLPLEQFKNMSDSDNSDFDIEDRVCDNWEATIVSHSSLINSCSNL
jgi:hypothetical protein